MKRTIHIALACMTLSGCAEHNLRQQIQTVEQEHRALSTFGGVETAGINATVEFALAMADGYAEAARQTANAQDAASVALIATAGSTVLGLANEVASAVLAERVIGAVAAEQFLQRGVPRDAILALYDGASRHNCVALSARIYRQEPAPSSGTAPANSIDEGFAAFLMVLVMREIEYRTFAGLARELESFGSLVTVFNDAVATVSTPASEEVTVRSGVAPASVPENPRVNLVEDAALQRFFQVLSGCLSSPSEGTSVTPTVPS